MDGESHEKGKIYSFPSTSGVSKLTESWCSYDTGQATAAR